MAAFAAVLLGLYVALGMFQSSSQENAVAATRTYDAHGVVRSFGPKRASVTIAHEKIAGYMDAMTMSFDARDDRQLAHLDVGDRVAFTFHETDDGRRLLDRIARE